jgi:hypothetical protein
VERSAALSPRVNLPQNAVDNIPSVHLTAAWYVPRAQEHETEEMLVDSMLAVEGDMSIDRDEEDYEIPDDEILEMMVSLSR